MMNFYVQQSIAIQLIKINGITNSSVLQIGSAGIIKPVSNLFNSGEFTEAAPIINKPGTTVIKGHELPAVTLAPPPMTNS